MNLRSAISVFGTPKHHCWKCHVDDFVPHCVQNQFDGGMKIEFDHDIAAMRFAVFNVMPSMVATSFEVLPSPTSCTTSRSRSVNRGGMATAGLTRYRCR